MKRFIFIVMVAIASLLFAKDIGKIERALAGSDYSAEQKARITALMQDKMIGDEEIEVIQRLITNKCIPNGLILIIEDAIYRKNHKLPNLLVETPPPAALPGYVASTSQSSTSRSRVPQSSAPQPSASQSNSEMFCAVQDLQLMANTYDLTDLLMTFPAIMTELQSRGITLRIDPSKSSLLAGLRNTDRYFSYYLQESPKDPNRFIPVNIIRAMIVVESMGNPEAIGPQTYCGRAKGLMQLIASTAKRFGCANRFDPQQNIRAGCAYLRYLAYDFEATRGNVDYILAGYNWGENNPVANRGLWPDETRKFVAKVKAIWQILNWIDQSKQQPQIARK